MEKLTISKLKSRAPKIPEYSCPVIDEIIADLSTDPDIKASKFNLIRKKLNNLRKQNIELRSSGVYWYEIAKKLVEIKSKTGYPDKFRTCWGKNTSEQIYKIASLLHLHGLEKGITLARQTNSKEALKAVKRDNIKLEAYSELEKKFNFPGYHFVRTQDHIVTYLRNSGRTQEHLVAL